MGVGAGLEFLCPWGWFFYFTFVALNNWYQIPKNDSMKAIYTDNRKDELPHAQNLVLALTAMLNGEEPTAALEIDGADPLQR
jgi:hypothetical protein